MMKDVTSLSAVWLELGMMCLNSSRHELSPAVAVIPVDPDDAYDNDPCRRELDNILDQFGYGTTDTVATTIFPYYLWNPKAPRTELFDRYFRLLPRIRKLNRRGVYFERLISYPGIKDQRGFNQLDHIITTYAHNNHRRSALQGSVIDPVQDLNNDSPLLGFPCMNQVGFLPDPARHTLTVTAYYPMQYMFRRAYGNYLGLVRLGRFMAHEMGFQCDRLICVASVGKVERHESAGMTDAHATQLRKLNSVYGGSAT
jgi:hypothetical protein